MMKRQLLFILALLLPMVALAASEPYAVLSSDGKTVTFYYDGNKASRGGVDINSSYKNNPYSAVTTVVFDASFADYRPTSTEYWFCDCSSLTSITGMEYLHTDNVTDMSWMFSSCSGLTSLDVSGFKTNNVTNMRYMFSGCSSLTSLDVSGFKTDKVTDMYGMFNNCSGLTSLDVSGFKTDNVTDMSDMFYKCESLTSLDVSGFKTDNVTNMKNMFGYCKSLTSLDLSSFNTENVTNMKGMFGMCNAIESLDVSCFKTGKVTDMSTMFSQCHNLTSLDMSGFNTGNVTDMSNMFYNCRSMTSVTLGKDFTQIPANFMSSSNRLKEVTSLIEQPTALVSNAFNSSAFNGTLWVPRGTKEKYQATDGWKQFKNIREPALVGEEFTTNGVTYQVTSISPYEVQVGTTSGEAPAVESTTKGIVNIPSKVLGADLKTYTVTGIANSAFAECTGLTEIRLPNTVTSIPARAFMNCSALTAVYMPTTVTSIGTRAFSGCSSLTSITLPFMVESIGQYAFAGCSKLKEVRAYMKMPFLISDNAFSSYDLTLYVPAGTVSKYESTDSWSAFANIKEAEVRVNDTFVDDDILYSVTSASPLEVSAGRTEGSPYAIDRLRDGLVEIPASVTHPDGQSYAVTGISNTAFSGCKLNYVSIPSSIRRIGELAFAGCSKLYEVYVTDLEAWCSIEFGDRSANPLNNSAARLYLNGEMVSDLTIPNSVKSISSYAFQGCSFSSITIPASVTNIGNAAFGSCYNVTSITVESGNTAYDSRNNCNAIINTKTNELIAGCQNTVIPNSVTRIGDEAFYGLGNKLTSVTIPNSVTSIGNYAFFYCYSITSITIPEAVESIGDLAFSRCSSLTSITIPSSVVSIGDRAFYDCSKLETFNIPASVKTLGRQAFQSTAWWKAQPDTIIYCDNVLLGYKGTSPTGELVVEDGTRLIADEAFVGCTNLTSVSIPASMTNIGIKAFWNCRGLTEVRSYIAKPFAIDNNVFSLLIYNNAILYVPEGSKALYEEVEGWKNFKEIREISLTPVEETGEVNYGGGGGINGETDLSGTVVNNMYYSIGTDAGGYSAEEGCIVITKETSDEQMELLQGLGITDAELNRNFTGIIFKVPAGKGKVTVNAETTGNMTLKVKVGSAETVEMELDGKLKMKFPYNVSEESLVYIFAGTTDEAAARGVADELSSLKIYGIEWQSESVKGDLNGDGNIDVGDIMAIINFMAAPTGEPGSFDLNGDGSVDVGDIMAIINIMAGQ